ncbi:TraR/DksA C4-type zinc finger protein [Georgenia sp. 10Sc9-8]|uniref:TraR/DksA C4-type zinc finger protein n=1 Tax=Georgenia halotolerans TaxID=3028317 RepID=A0ABT5TV27_9MICO|nr:TraR/DksA C4-type zinc finger protein [Georgenia halotolerans]
MAEQEPDVGTTVVRQRLKEELAAARSRLAALSASRAEVVAASTDANVDDEHDPEGATLGFERAQLRALTVRTQERLTAVEHALARLAAGTYGRCARCGEQIAPARLSVRPTATTCVRCAR